MEIDWVIAVALFIIFVTWAFGYYASLYSFRTDSLKSIAEVINDKIIGFLTLEVETVPIKYSAVTPSERVILYFEHKWPFGKNTTKIFSQDSVELPCYIENITVFFQTNLTSGDNIFNMVYKDENITEVKCSGAFFRENETRVIPISAVRESISSQEKINEMTNMSYEDFKGSLNILRDFRVEIEKGNENITFGLLPPPVLNVFVKETLTELEETGEDIKIRVLVW